MSKGSNGSKYIQTYTFVNWSDDNTETLRLFRDDPDMHIIIATDALMVGVDLPNVQDIVIISAVENLDSLLQKIGGAGRDGTLAPDTRGIVYLMHTARKTAQAIISNTHHQKTAADGNQTQD